MTISVKPRPEDPALADLTMETLMRFAREGLKLSRLALKPGSYLRLAWALGVDDPDAKCRLVQTTSYPGRNCTFHSAAPYVEVRVGTSFRIYGPTGVLTIEEDLT